MGDRKLRGDKLTPDQLQMAGDIVTMPGEFRDRQDQPVRTLPGTQMAVVADPRTGVVERDVRALQGNPQLVPAEHRSLLERFVRGAVALHPATTISRAIHERGPDPRTAPRSVAVPPTQPTAAQPNLQNILQALQGGHLDTIAATDLASRYLSLDDQRALDRYLRTLPPPPTPSGDGPVTTHSGGVQIQRMGDGSVRVTHPQSTSVIGPHEKRNTTIAPTTDALGRLLALLGGR